MEMTDQFTEHNKYKKIHQATKLPIRNIKPFNSVHTPVDEPIVKKLTTEELEKLENDFIKSFCNIDDHVHSKLEDSLKCETCSLTRKKMDCHENSLNNSVKNVNNVNNKKNNGLCLNCYQIFLSTIKFNLFLRIIMSKSWSLISKS